MNEIYGRDLDLNLLRVFLVVADTGSVTEAASRLYLTQPAVSAALRRLNAAVRAKLFARSGRHLVLTARGDRLKEVARPHLQALVQAALSPPVFDPRRSERVIRLGLSDASEMWLLPRLLKTLTAEAPALQVIVLPVQWRTVGEALVNGRLDLAVTVADELPADITRTSLFVGGFTCLYDGRKLRLPRELSEEAYFSHAHVIVSYNGDLRGIVEDTLGRTRNVRVSVPSFAAVGPVIDGSRLLATVPELTAQVIRKTRPHLRTAHLPFDLGGTPMELLCRKASADDPALAFVRERIERIAAALG